jgi:hypothetical protein
LGDKKRHGVRKVEEKSTDWLVVGKLNKRNCGKMMKQGRQQCVDPMKSGNVKAGRIWISSCILTRKSSKSLLIFFIGLGFQ